MGITETMASVDLSLLGRVLTLQEYNTRLVVLSTTLLGWVSGLIGSFLLLRKRSLMGDVLSHACLPGLALAFLLMVAAGGSGRFFPGLMVGAILTGLLGTVTVMVLLRWTLLREDAAMGLVLGVFFGLGVVFLGFVQQVPGASAAGLESFLYGKTASMRLADFYLISLITVGVIAITFLLRRTFSLMAFDEGFARSLGLKGSLVDATLLLLIALVTVVGMQAVGLILILAFLIIPAAGARFWTENLRTMVWIAMLAGALSGWAGSSLSALLPRLPAGAVIVLASTGFFILSLFFGSKRGLWVRLRTFLRTQQNEGRQHLLRASYEWMESRVEGGAAVVNIPVPLEALHRRRSWSPPRLKRLLKQGRRSGLLTMEASGKYVNLSEAGFGEAQRTTRNHRLWECYLITHADVAPSHVDRDADAVEHVLSPELVRELERAMGQMSRSPVSPHPLLKEIR